jgi:hypothetical protein
LRAGDGCAPLRGQGTGAGSERRSYGVRRRWGTGARQAAAGQRSRGRGQGERGLGGAEGQVGPKTLECGALVVVARVGLGRGLFAGGRGQRPDEVPGAGERCLGRVSLAGVLFSCYRGRFRPARLDWPLTDPLT